MQKTISDNKKVYTDLEKSMKNGTEIVKQRVIQD